MKLTLKISKSSLLACILLAGCSGSSGGIGQLGSGILNSAGLGGYVSSSQADSMLDAGGKLVKAAEGFTDEQEYYLGRSVSAVILSKYPPVTNQSLVQYVNKVGRTVAGFSDRPDLFGGYHFMVLDTSEINAVSAPGGFIFISKGLLRLMPDEDALAAVLAHEVGHVVLGHGVKAVSRSNLTSALLLIGKEAAASQGGAEVQALSSALGDSVTDITNAVLTDGYSRSQEYDADEYAAKLLERAGYNPQALVGMLKAIEKSGNHEGGWFATHPSPERRIDEIEGELPDSKGDVEGQSTRAARFRAALGNLG